MTNRKNKQNLSTILVSVVFSVLFGLGSADEIYINTTTLNTVTYAVSPDGNALYIATTGREIKRYNYTKFINAATFTYSTSHTKDIRVIGVSAGEHYFASGSEDYLIEVVVAFTQTKICTLEHYNQIRALKFDPNNEEVLFAASVDDQIRKWNVSNC